MQLRSWMAAVVLAAGATGWQVGEVSAQTAGSDRTPRPDAKKTESSVAAKPADESPESPDCHSVKLHLMVAGLGHNGCDVDVKPGSRGCRFRPRTVHIGSDGTTRLLFRDVELRGADRNCTFSITIREPGRKERTIFRGFRIPVQAPGASPSKLAQSFTCYVNSPSKLIGLEMTDKVRK